MVHWNLLPPVVRQKIIVAAAEGNPLLSELATVCQEWSYLVEEVNLRCFTVSSDRFETFRALLDRRQARQAYLRHLKYIVHVRYRDGVPFLNEEGDMQEMYVLFILAKVWRLLKYLSRWDYELIKSMQKPYFQGVALEISLHCHADRTPQVIDGPVQQLSRRVRDRLMRQLRKRRNAGPKDEWHVHVISKLFIHHQSGFKIPPSAVAEICRQLPRLSEIGYEARQLRGASEEIKALWCGLAALAAVRKSSSLRKVHLVHGREHAPAAADSGAALESRGANPRKRCVGRCRPAATSVLPLAAATAAQMREYRAMASMLARMSTTLEELFICNVTEAHVFMEELSLLPVPTTWGAWASLTRVTLTTMLFSPGGAVEANLMLLQAGRAAERLPALRVMELFRVGFKHGFLFQYKTRGPTCTFGAQVRWLSTWPFELEFVPYSRWRKTALLHNRVEPQIGGKVISRGVPHADTIFAVMETLPLVEAGEEYRFMDLLWEE